MIRIAGNWAPKRRRSSAMAAMPVPLVEMIIDQEPVERRRRCDRHRDRGGKVRRLQHPAAPAAQQRLHAVEHLGLVVDAQHGDAGELGAVGRGAVARNACTGAALDTGTVTEKREPRRGAERSSTL